MRQRGETREAALADARRALERDALQLRAALAEHLRTTSAECNTVPDADEDTVKCRCSAETGTGTHLERVVGERAVVVEHEQLESRAHGGEVRVPARRELLAAAQVELLEPHGQAAARRREVLERAVREARALRDVQRHEVLAEAASIRVSRMASLGPGGRQEKRSSAGVQAGAGALGDAPDGGVAD